MEAARTRVLLLAPPTSYRIPAYLAAARALGLEAVLVSEGRHALTPEVARGLHVDFSNTAQALERIMALARTGTAVGGVVATDDSTVEVAAEVSAVLGLVHNAPQSARIARRKDLARAALARAHLPVPDFHCLDLDSHYEPQLETVRFPCVVKPIAMSASRGVIRANDHHELRSAIQRTAAIAAGATRPLERRRLLIERFIPGPEIAVEGLLRAGALEPLAVFDKPDPLDGPFFEETYYVTPSRLPDSVQRRALAVTAAACRAYGLVEGPVHAELRIDHGEPWILEVAARTIGGDCARLLQFNTGRSLEELVLAHAIGQRPALSGAEGAAGVLMIPTVQRGILRRVEGVLAARRVPGVEEVSIVVREGYELVPLPEGGSYLGFVFAKGPSPANVERALREAHGHLNVVVAPAWQIERGWCEAGREKGVNAEARLTGEGV